MSGSLPLFPATGFTKNRSRIRCVDAVCNVARRLWPSKTAINIASRAEISKRGAELWLEGRTEPGADAIINLLRSDAGFELLQELMQGSGTKWWRDFERGVRITEIENQMKWQADQLSKLKTEFAR
jgi:hypothetical protein|nr:MAG TPA: hypothetical protein [Caudoviricetes sp.]